jgi:hypothetical protein
MAVPALPRGTVFRAEHDSSYLLWQSDEPRSIAVAFNLTLPSAAGDAVHYFLATSKVARFRENPTILDEVAIFAAGSYPFFPEETAIDFRLCG